MSGMRMVDLLKSGALTPDDALDALEQRIAEVEPYVNALPTLCFDRAREHAARLRDVPPQDRGLLYGLPVPIKDLTDVSGVRTTYGSLMFKDFVPQTTGMPARRLEENCAIIYAKSNTPEFGTGGHTKNKVFGVTRNPRDLLKSAGGSSGGAAAALASGMAWVAHGSDMAGSLRTPASFCGVASLRPSPGLIATDPGNFPFQVLAQEGPMARCVEDVALLADAMCGLSQKAGLSMSSPMPPFLMAAQRPKAPGRIAFSADLGVTDTSDAVRTAFEAAIGTLEKAGLAVEENHPDLSEANEAFTVLRAIFYAVNHGDQLAEGRQLFYPEVIWNTEKGLDTDASEIRNALVAQGRTFARAAHFMNNYDLLICPAAIIPPFPVEESYPGASSGVPVSDYYKWLKIVYVISATTLPVITITCGKMANGLPLGIQLIGKPHGEQALFSIARHLEDVLNWNPEPVNPT